MAVYKKLKDGELVLVEEDTRPTSEVEPEAPETILEPEPSTEELTDGD